MHSRVLTLGGRSGCRPLHRRVAPTAAAAIASSIPRCGVCSRPYTASAAASVPAASSSVLPLISSSPAAFFSTLPGASSSASPVSLRSQVRVGQAVSVVTKADQGTGRLTRGVVEALLTSAQTHPRGIKVRLQGGVVGRVHTNSSTFAAPRPVYTPRATPVPAAAPPSPFSASGPRGRLVLTASGFTRRPSPPLSSRPLHTRAGPLLNDISTAIPGGAPVNVVFITPEGERVPVTGVEGENLLALAHANDIELEGACEASLACSTCHVILPEEYYDKLETPVDEEEDMLDLAFGLTTTSRLGCQVKLSKELEGMEITLPSATRNMAVDGHKPKPH